MPAKTYSTIPTLVQWKSDSNVTFAIRNQDIILTHIDALIDMYHKCSAEPSRKSLILCDLFQTINFWVKSCKDGSKWTDKARYRAIRDLFDGVLTQLKQVLGVDSDLMVSNEMKFMFGVAMTTDGCDTDKDKGMKRFTEDELAQYRVWFKGGVAYQLPWWDNSGALKRQLANSSHGYKKMVRGDNNFQSKNYSGFIMTLNRELYMTKQDPDKKHFHSSYNGGIRVAAAGTIRIEDGRIRGVRTDSGHYQPRLNSLYTFLWALVMYQVNLRDIEIFDYQNEPQGRADEFLQHPDIWKTQNVGRGNEQIKQWDREKHHGWGKEKTVKDDDVVLKLY